MSYLLDPAYRAIQHLRSEDTGVAIADAWERWTGSKPKKVHTESVWTAYRPRHKAREVLHVKIFADSGELHEMDILFCAFMDEASYEAQQSNSTVQTPSDVLPPMVDPERRTLAWVLPYVPKP